MIGCSKIVLGLAVFISAAATIIDACPESSVNLYLYNGKTGKDNPCHLTANSCPDLNNCDFHPHSRTVVIIHDWAGSYVGNCPTVIKNAYVDKILQDGKHINVILVDYSPCASNYTGTVTWTKEIGGAAAKIVQHLAHSCDLNLKSVECVGFGFGAHICGTFSSKLTVKNKRIVALDTASPVVSTFDPESKLDKFDADYVSCVHSSSHLLSITHAFCDCDIYPNGAKNQPGCNNTDIYQVLAGTCDRARACEYFAYSISYPKLFPLHKQCDTSYDALSNKCNDTVSTVGYMGEPNHEIFGIYWLDVARCLKEHGLN